MAEAGGNRTPSLPSLRGTSGGDSTTYAPLRKKAPGAVDRLDDTPAALGGSKTVANGALPKRSSREVIEGVGGPRGDRTPDLLIANQALSQLS
jgi:hypothetical protein